MAFFRLGAEANADDPGYPARTSDSIVKQPALTRITNSPRYHATCGAAIKASAGGPFELARGLRLHFPPPSPMRERSAGVALVSLGTL